MVKLDLLRDKWRNSPKWAQKILVCSGLPYVVSFVLHYRESHRIQFFAGNLERLNLSYISDDKSVTPEDEKQFERILNGLVLPSGVRKTTYGDRLSHIVEEVFASVRLPMGEIRVLDLPSSSGIASLKKMDLLKKSYSVKAYVLGDLYHHVLYDANRRCIFDLDGNLLQVGFKNYYFGVYLAHKLGNHYNIVSSFLLFPHAFVGFVLKQLYRPEPKAAYARLTVVHPQVLRLMKRGQLQLEVMDIFKPIADFYDLIFSFNLLQKNYFPTEMIASGVANLAGSLSEGGILLLGNTECYHALQKQDGVLITRLRKGTF